MTTRPSYIRRHDRPYKREPVEGTDLLRQSRHTSDMVHLQNLGKLHVYGQQGIERASIARHCIV